LGGQNISGATADTVYMPKVELAETGQGIIMKSPDGTRYKITIANGGTLNIALA
jgi:nitrogen fixation protein